MSRKEIDDYLTGLDEPKRSTLEALRTAILAVVPDAEEGLAYGVPGFRLHGKVIAGFAAHKTHLGYYPHSDTVLAELADDVAGYSCSKGTLRFAVDTPMADALVERLVAARLAELDG